ncbi:lipoprotein [Microbulbifer bruguierae]|uniref:Lipoprotein n=1 Tax=Microbulbifer bruguierae TaxID=3029061 RepID=A0ABY8N8D0_9GAMM|nr:lipoprotein [Microbulbifer bruguierae]WGL15146.1 lipoprotein [Microbulbifer bruguierae]
MRTPIAALALLIALIGQLSGCGQKGPLYLPQDPAQPGSAPAAPGTGSSVPAGAEGEQEKPTTPENQPQQNTEAEAVSK